ncbi:C4-type zinc ribbon domain-containing protein [Desulfocurvibacter africanus]|uniref:Uncharacterized protein n=2 Tax=Desulfocurvibacter africanus TaxID=873 RepID=F3YZ55_DESAF|nr:C4-type zinc ribbon domain-containing protein [Desulfocurvibacter africanus]EGJ50811.1 protein of unknown function DUF164 [Desulfocurvibacter africanus subsp. africanus str. Walvis Bay]EMG35757.1 Zn-ribbon protein, possibly nucleic acid-binding protein [Desulfocurvibacter africanus PCS]
MYQKQIEQLVILQQIDAEITDIRKDLEGAPKELQTLEQQYKDVQERRDQTAGKIENLRSQQSHLGQDIEDDSSRIKKSKNKLMMASNTREYHAMMREMDNMEKVNRLREEENAALMDELKRQQELLTSEDEELSTLGTRLDEMRKTLDKRMAEAQKLLDGLMKRRKAAGEIIPKPILSRYEFIRARLRHPVIVSVGEGVCSGCHILIPPQTFNDLQKGKQIHSCPNCQRLIFWSEHLPSTATEREEA